MNLLIIKCFKIQLCRADIVVLDSTVLRKQVLCSYYSGLRFWNSERLKIQDAVQDELQARSKCALDETSVKSSANLIFTLILATLS